MYKEIIRNKYGDFVITHEDGQLCSVDLCRDTLPETPLTPFGAMVQTQLCEYFEGRRKAFDIPLNPQLPPFARKICLLLADIPYGETISYKELAIRAGHPKACRAVGSAVGRNPILILLPCHRVIQSGGGLGGFALGLGVKRDLLRLEGSLRKGMQ